MRQNKEQAICVWLDVLLDTRMGTLDRVDPEAAVRVLKSGTYHERLSDRFEGVDMDRYRELYAQRDRETLQRSAPTEGFVLVQQLVKLLRDQAVEMNSPYRGNPKVVVNTYPYQLSSEELDELGKSIAVRLGGLVPVELTRISDAELSPAFVKANFIMLVMYEYDPWMSLHYNVDPSKIPLKELMKMFLKEVTIFSPAIYFKDPPDEDTVKKLMKETNHPLVETEMLANTLVGLHLVDVSFFSLMRLSSKQA